MIRHSIVGLVLILTLPHSSFAADAVSLKAGVAKVEVTKPGVLPIGDPLYVKALVLSDGVNQIALITVDAVAIGEIGPIKNDYLGKVRTRLQKELGIDPERVIVNASHCHGIVCNDVDDKTVLAVTRAAKSMVPVKVGVGTGFEKRISENRRLTMKDGRVIDIRHAYSMPPDSAVASVGPIDPEIGILRLDTMDNRTLAVVYNFACHPIMGVPNGGNTADYVGFASKVIEENLSEGTIAMFVQGCGGDINPVGYKDVQVPHDAEPLGHKLGLSALRAIRAIKPQTGATMTLIHEKIALPRADNTERIVAQEAELLKLMRSLKGTTLNLKSFMELVGKYDLSREFPSYYSYRYLHEAKIGNDDLRTLDANNRRNIASYIANIHTMEQITRAQTNLTLLKRHHDRNLLAGRKPIEVELNALQIGDFVLITFPGELTVEIGLAVKKSSPHPHTFVAGYTNGYIYYTPTAKQLENVGGAQEDSDCVVAPEWEKLFRDRVDALLKKLKP